ncbi:LppU family putative lipoprotein [Nocardia sp. bgisy134]|uniref:LppU family putative lipoprotein n=1 Tax=unclassified Nocardia TaxID=2637762 RepID=UPI003D753422
MSRQLLSGIALAIGTAAAVFALVACSSTISGTAQPAVDSGTIDAVNTSTPKTSAPRSSARPTSGRPTPTGGNTDFEASIGDCVTLGGTTTNATIAKASCGSRASNYKVIGKTPTSSGCPADRDNYYAETINGVQQGALCLDIDWVVGGCMDVGGDDPKRIDCTERGTQGVRVTNIKTGATDASVCDSGIGFEYSERRFVVCVEEL